MISFKNAKIENQPIYMKSFYKRITLESSLRVVYAFNVSLTLIHFVLVFPSDFFVISKI